MSLRGGGVAHKRGRDYVPILRGAARGVKPLARTADMGVDGGEPAISERSQPV
jgi:hypothetical protein